MYRQNTHLIAFTGIFIALLLGVGYALAFVPNVELLTAMVFMSGVLMGFKRGIIIGVVGEFLFSTLNPMGSGLLFPPMLIAQVVAMAVVSFSGALMRNFVLTCRRGLLSSITMGGIGLLLTLFYDILVSAAFPVSAGFSFREVVGTIIAGLAFSTVHLIGNTLVFILLVPLAAQQVYRAIPFFSEYLPLKSSLEISDVH